MISRFHKASKQQAKLRLANIGPSGSGKTYTSLLFAVELGKKVALIDTERGSASKYANLFDFDVLDLESTDPREYMKALREAGEEGYEVIIVDSLSHAWEGTLAIKDQVTARSKSNDSFGAWREVTPIHNDLVDTMLRLPAHLIVTMRTRTEYVIEKDPETGKNKPRRVGLKPIQRDGLEYEFDIVADMDHELHWIASKTRCPELSGAVFREPGASVAEIMAAWLSDGEPVSAPRDVAELKRAMDAIEPEDRRRAAKQAYLDTFGRPEQLPAARFDEAKEFVAKFGSPPANGDKSSTEEAHRDAPVGQAGGEVSASSPSATIPKEVADRNRKRIHAEANKAKLTDDDQRHVLIEWATGGATASSSEVGDDQIDAVLDAIKEYGSGGLAFVDEGQGLKVETKR